MLSFELIIKYKVVTHPDLSHSKFEDEESQSYRYI